MPLQAQALQLVCMHECRCVRARMHVCMCVRMRVHVRMRVRMRVRVPVAAKPVYGLSNHVLMIIMIMGRLSWHENIWLGG